MDLTNSLLHTITRMQPKPVIHFQQDQSRVDKHGREPLPLVQHTMIYSSSNTAHLIQCREWCLYARCSHDVARVVVQHSLDPWGELDST